MNAPRPVEIVGGGLAGLGLGLALRARGVPVTVWEAATYPRPKVCGEFIAGLHPATVRAIGLEPLLAGHARHRVATWHTRRGRLARLRLPGAAVGVSRQWLDTQMAARLREAGGRVHEGRRLDPAEARPGRVQAHGRRRRAGGWLGLKLHVRGLTLDGDLEMHLGERAYVGLAGVEDGRINVCGLFAPRPVPSGPPEEILDRYLRAAGLDRLADRIAAATALPDSRATVAGVHFGRFTGQPPESLALGDAFGAIPPFTGHGMAMALESAALAAEPITEWSQGGLDWPAAAGLVQRRLRRRFAVRLAAARLLHPFLFAERGQRLLARLAAHRLLPFRPLSHTLHGGRAGLP